MKNINNEIYSHSQNCVYTKGDGDSIKIMKLDEGASQVIEVNNVVKELWLILESECTFEKLVCEALNVFSGETEGLDEKVKAMLNKMLELGIIEKK